MSLMLNSNSDDSETLYSDSVFSTYLYTGNGSPRTITNGIDLAGKGGLVWLKSRTVTNYHYLTDTARGTNSQINTNTTDAAETLTNRVTSFNSTGFSIGASSHINSSDEPQVSWTFRKAAKFFDVVTYTGNGVAGRQIAHSLGCAVGMLIIKRTNAGGNDWAVWNAGAPTLGGRLNQTGEFESGYFYSWCNSTAPTSSVFSVGTDATVNASGGTYVAYLFAHDTSSTGIIQCGSFTTDGSGNATVNLGWEPQYVMTKGSSVAESWRITDISRGMSATGGGFQLQANSSLAEEGTSQPLINSTGFKTTAYSSSHTFIYLAIRRPNKPPTSGTQVYNAIARTGTGAAATVTGVGFAPDLFLGRQRTPSNTWSFSIDRLRGVSQQLTTQTTDAESSGTIATSFAMDGVSLNGATSNLNQSAVDYINHFFRRAPGFFDEVCYTGTGANTTQAHNLTVVPELMIVKARSLVGRNWSVYSKDTGNTSVTWLNLDSATQTSRPNYWNSTTPTASVFSMGSDNDVNASGSTYVAYLFATLAGISKVGSYTGNGSTQNIECGFAAGARFVLIKRTDSTGDWYVWDTARGIVTGNDPHLSLNSTAAEVTTDDSIDPYSPGFTVNQVAATNINVTSATYIFLAIA